MYSSGERQPNDKVARDKNGNVSIHFEELDYCPTEMGDLTLRRRRMASLGDVEVFEVKLGDDFLMSSLFTKVEEALAELALTELTGDAIDVAIGGLGLGYTARAALAHRNVRSVTVIEKWQRVIDWHRRGLVPLGLQLTGDPRCRLLLGDFFAQIASDALDPGPPGRLFHAILLDIDHAPGDLLHPRHASFYEAEGLQRLKAHLQPGGVFGMWADGQPDEVFQGRLDQVLTGARVHVVSFPNPITGEDSSSTVYIAKLAA